MKFELEAPARPAKATPLPAAADEVRALLAGYSLEVVNRRAEDVERCTALVPPGARVAIAFAPSDRCAQSVATAARLRRAGFEPVPHVAARYFADAAALESFVARLRGEAGVAEVFVVAGDRHPPAGAFASSLELLQTGVLARHGIAGVGFAAYPEGHPTIPEGALIEAMRRKAALAAAQGLACRFVTQFCFEAGPIEAWLARYRTLGFAAPVRIGIAGPASAPALMRFGLRCGVGASVRALAQRGGRLARLAREATPDALMAPLARLRAAPGGEAVEGLHFFTFGGIAPLAAWIAAAQESNAGKRNVPSRSTASTSPTSQSR
jgi:methylenetetrahydrofolate reductase (NADPH)